MLSAVAFCNVTRGVFRGGARVRPPIAKTIFQAIFAACRWRRGAHACVREHPSPVNMLKFVHLSQTVWQRWRTSEGRDQIRSSDYASSTEKSWIRDRYRGRPIYRPTEQSRQQSELSVNTKKSTFQKRRHGFKLFHLK